MGWGGRGETLSSISTSTRLLSSGVPFTLSGNTTASIFISREIEIFCLPFPSLLIVCEFPVWFVIFLFLFLGRKLNLEKKYRMDYEDFVKIKIISIVEC